MTKEQRNNIQAEALLQLEAPDGIVGVTRTSVKSHHLLWLLDAANERDRLEDENRRLTHEADVATSCLNELLR